MSELKVSKIRSENPSFSTMAGATLSSPSSLNLKTLVSPPKHSQNHHHSMEFSSQTKIKTKIVSANHLYGVSLLLLLPLWIESKFRIIPLKWTILTITSTTKDVSTPLFIGDEKIGVLLLNLGGPETLDDVQAFLFNLFDDPDIIRLPRLVRFLQGPLAQFISVLIAPKSKEGYASIGGGSPLRRITDEHDEELRKSLWENNVPAKVYVRMRYWHPFTEKAIEQIKRDGIGKLVVLPLYPQFSISTSGSSLRLLESIFRENEYLVNMQHTVIPSWYQREGYIKAMANLIEKE